MPAAPIPATQSLHMIFGQLFTNEVLDERLLAAFASSPRELFVPPQLAGCAYTDDDLPIGNNRFLIAPLPLARLIQLADISPEDKVLVVGCNTGYSLAVIARLAKKAVGMDTETDFIEAAKKNLGALGIRNAAAEQAPALAEGLPAGAPYDAILIEGAVEAVPDALKRQLSPHGRLVAAERAAPAGLVQGLSRLTVYVPAGKGFSRKVALDAALPSLPGFERRKGFVF